MTGTKASPVLETLLLRGLCYFCEDGEKRKWEMISIHTHTKIYYFLKQGHFYNMV